MSQYKYIIYAPIYDETVGGAIVMHKLCHLINECGGQAYLYPFVPSFELHHYNIQEIGLYIKAIHDASQVANFRVNPAFKTPVITPRDNLVAGDDCIVVYPEIAFGNPLRAKNTVRWLLHNPGFHTGRVYFGSGEVYYRHGDSLLDNFQFHGSVVSDVVLRVQHVPLDLYIDDAPPQRDRSGTAYCLRKGKGRPAVHDLDDSILIDGKTHAETAAIFKSVKRFISYDPYTHYSYFAAIAGCESVVVPVDNMSKEQWRPNIEDRYGLAYGFDDLEFARATRELAINRQIFLNNQSKECTLRFMEDIERRLAAR